jgi:hypothetical protein
MSLSITVLLSALAIVAASPTLPPRACGTVYPTLFSLLSPEPGFFHSVMQPAKADTPLRTLLDSPHVRLQHIQGTEGKSQDNFQFIDFKIPAGSNTCQLEITDHANMLYFEKTNDNNAAPPAMNTMKLIPGALYQDPSTENVTYADVMDATPPVIQYYHWGAATLQRGQSSIIGSFACPPANGNGEDGHAQFVLQFDPDQLGVGSCDWVLPQSTTDPGALGLVSGIYLTHC